MKWEEIKEGMELYLSCYDGKIKKVLVTELWDYPTVYIKVAGDVILVSCEELYLSESDIYCHKVQLLEESIAMGDRFVDGWDSKRKKLKDKIDSYSKFIKEETSGKV
ncbi:hypothetical protein [Sulfurimonas sp.]|uniref:hypothetical protein n=1 Tax=Sulfurimonas sp. TaxID=2022749 RepID=UPI003D112189